MERDLNKHYRIQLGSKVPPAQEVQVLPAHSLVPSRPGKTSPSPRRKPGPRSNRLALDLGPSLRAREYTHPTTRGFDGTGDTFSLSAPRGGKGRGERRDADNPFDRVAIEPSGADRKSVGRVVLCGFAWTSS
jgi:hypothetical protein